MRSALVSPEEFRNFAAQCQRWAARAKSEQHKNKMLQMANHWMQRAHELERTDRSRCVLSEAPSASMPPQNGAQ